MTIEFRIDQTKLCVSDSDFDTTDSFLVNSFPRPYTVEFASHLAEFSKILSSTSGPIIVDDFIYGVYKSWFLNRSVFIVNSVEANKTIETAIQIIEFLDKNNVNKGVSTYAIGGGVVQDLVGFAAGVYKRGVPWIYCPTTLLGQADSCIGGKTGLNFHGKKNVVCSFSAPSKVIICSEFISTLSPTEIRSGLGEMFRLAVTGGYHTLDNFGHSLNRSPQITELDIKRSLLVKRAVVEADEYEMHERRAMNVGHTIGHALEAAVNHGVSHGVLVAFGIAVEALIANKYVGLSENNLNRIFEFVDQICSSEDLNYISQISPGEILTPLMADKKMVGSDLNFALITDIGQVTFYPINVESNVCEIEALINLACSRLN